MYVKIVVINKTNGNHAEWIYPCNFVVFKDEHVQISVEGKDNPFEAN